MPVSRADKGGQAASLDESPGRQITRRLIESHLSDHVGTHSAARATADACNGLYRELSRWVGPDGSRALFTRALAATRMEFRSMNDFQLLARSETQSDGANIIVTHADDATAEGIEAMLVHVVELLGRLIGSDMALKLIGRALAVPGGTNAGSVGKREET